jgi:hypothetical protein
MMNKKNQDNALIVWNLLGSFLIPFSLSLITWITIRDWGFYIYAISIPIFPTLIFLNAFLDENLQSLWLGDSGQKGRAAFRVICSLLAPLSLTILLPYLGFFVGLYISATMLLWTLPAVWFQLWQNQPKRKNSL